MRIVDLRSDLDQEIPRPVIEGEPVEKVREIVERVRAGGDRALLELTAEFDGVRLSQADLAVRSEEIEHAATSIPPGLRAAIKEAASRLRGFAERQLIRPWDEGGKGRRLGEIVHPVERAGLYAPGGRAVYPSVVVMCAVPASVAGVERIVLCVPPGKDGGVPAATLAAAHLTGVTEVYRVGGAQAIAAMAFGTETIPRVDVIAGGGGLFVALAKREVAGFVAIDSVAGPSEIAIIAGPGADPSILAADLIAQAEHGPHGSFVLFTWDQKLILEVEKQIEVRLERASSDLAAALEEGAVGVLVAGVDQAVEAAARFAPEHLELIGEEAERAAGKVRNAGAIFVGRWSPVSLGDYLAGSNHTLPTMGSARWASGLRASMFQRVMAVVRYEEESLRTAVPHVQALAEAEGLPNHARAVEARFEENEATR